MLEYFIRYGATKTSLRYKVSRKTVYKWASRYDGSIRSLKDKSRRPHTSPKAHSPDELAMVKRALKKVKWQDLILAYQRLTSRGYTRSYGGFKRLVQRLRAAKPKAKPKRKPKPYQRAVYPGQKVQIDVMYVPRECHARGMSGSKSFYQFTAIDECTRWVYRQMYDDKSSYSAKLFLDELVRSAPFPIRMVQTDNGSEFTNSLQVTKATHKTLFEQTLEDLDIIYKRIRIATPRHNGKVERQHRIDRLRFYSTLKMFSLADGRKQLKAYQAKSNNYIKTCLGMKSPNQLLIGYLAVMF
jgi:transposase InsO family protein